MKYILDCFKQCITVCEVETKNTVDINKSELPSKVNVGDVVIFEKNHYRLNNKETEQHRKEIHHLTEGLFED